MPAAEKERFRRDGYCVVRGLIPSDEVARLSGWVTDLARAPDVPGGVMRYLEQDRIEYFRPHNEGLCQLMERGRIPALMSELLDEEAVLFKDKINFKPPGGASFEPHQDAQAGWLDYCAYQITCMVAIDAAGSTNGGLELAAGHHRRGLIGEPGRPLSGAELSGLDFVLCEMSPGDAVFFDCFVPHRSGPNHSSSERRILYLTYNARSAGDHYEAYFAAKRKSFPPDWEREPGREYRYRV